MARQTIQEIYGDDDDNVGQELTEIIKRLKEKYGDDWASHLDEVED